MHPTELERQCGCRYEYYLVKKKLSVHNPQTQVLAMTNESTFNTNESTFKSQRSYIHFLGLLGAKRHYEIFYFKVVIRKKTEQ